MSDDHDQAYERAREDKLLRRDLDKLAANYVTQLAKLQRENEALRKERDAARADAEQLAEALRGMFARPWSAEWNSLMAQARAALAAHEEAKR